MTMREFRAIPQRIAIASNPELPEAAVEGRQIANYLEQQGVSVTACSSLYDQDLRQKIQAGEFDILIALGGDGTMLRAGRLCAQFNLPILGINMGHFGFLMEVKRDQWHDIIPNLLEGKFRLEDRMMLRAEHWRSDQLLGTWDVLNEVVICRGQFVRPVRLKASVDGYLLTTFVADGLIAATPTGSSAYALAAGGPIMPPELRNILIIPVAPHLSVDRAIILSEGARVTITVHTNHEAVLSVDGQPPIVMLDGDTVNTSAGDHPASFIRFQDAGYFYRNLTLYMEQNPTTGDHK